MSRPDMRRDKTFTHQPVFVVCPEPALFKNEQTIFQTNILYYLYVYDFKSTFILQNMIIIL